MYIRNLILGVGVLLAAAPAFPTPLSSTNVFSWDQSDYGISFSLVGAYGAVKDSVQQGSKSGHVYLCRVCRDCAAQCDKWVMVRFARKTVEDSPLESYTLINEQRFKDAKGIVEENRKRVSLDGVLALDIVFSNTSNEPTTDIPGKGKGRWLVADANGIRYKVLAFDARGGDVVGDAELSGVFKTLKFTDMRGQPPPIVTNPPRYVPIDFAAKNLTTFGITLGESVEAAKSKAATNKIIVSDQKYKPGANDGNAGFAKALDGSTSALNISAQYHGGIVDQIYVITRDDYFFRYLRDELNRRTTVIKADRDFDYYMLKFGGSFVSFAVLRAGEGRQGHFYFRRED